MKAKLREYNFAREYSAPTPVESSCLSFVFTESPGRFEG